MYRNARKLLRKLLEHEKSYINNQQDATVY